MITENDRKLGKRIQRLRKRASLTQEKLAEKAKLSAKYIQFIETAHRSPSLKTIQKLARALGTKAKDLFPY